MTLPLTLTLILTLTLSLTLTLTLTLTLSITQMHFIALVHYCYTANHTTINTQPGKSGNPNEKLRQGFSAEKLSMTKHVLFLKEEEKGKSKQG